VFPTGAVNTFTGITPSATFLTFCLTDGVGRGFRHLDRTVPRNATVDEVVPMLVDLSARHGVTLAAPGS
jgi:hypothetical protein